MIMKKAMMMRVIMKMKQSKNNVLMCHHYQEFRLFNIIQKVFKHVRVFPFNRDKNSFTVSITFSIRHETAARRRNKVTMHGIASPYTSRQISMCLIFFVIYLFTYSNAMVYLSEYPIKHTPN